MSTYHISGERNKARSTKGFDISRIPSPLIFHVDGSSKTL